MKKISYGLSLVSALLFLFPLAGVAQRSCGEGYLFSKWNAEDPAKMQELRRQHDQMTADAIARYQNISEKTAALSPIPLAFHFVLTQAQYYAIGGDTGIKRRVNSQVAALNRDYGGLNADKAKIPGGFKPLFGTIGLQFGVANTSSAFTITPGVEVRIVSSPPKYSVDNSCAAVKTANDGLAGWNPAKYLNIWVASIWAGSISNTILGVTVPPTFIGYSGGGHNFDSSDLGIVINYGTLGAREFPAQFFNIPTIDRGRTLTHEMGHYFELWHTWGDDNGLCPSNGGSDDGINDTPPQADATYCSSTGVCPKYPVYDACTKTGDGIMFMNYMDYVDDSAMFMFTAQQSFVMKAQFEPTTSESYSLTQQPGTTKLAVENLSSSPAVWSLSPNPATGVFHLTLDKAEGFKSAVLLNMMGQAVVSISGRAGITQYDFDLSAAPRGIYLVQCHFDGGTLTKKLVLQ